MTILLHISFTNRTNKTFKMSNVCHERKYGFGHTQNIIINNDIIYYYLVCTIAYVVSVNLCCNLEYFYCI